MWFPPLTVAKETASSLIELENHEEQSMTAQALMNYWLKEKMAMANSIDPPI